eukprot:m.142861 g.142861  ORF g.142861 m.142861 type:complete len:250 (+) comp20416_c0_seq6:575-1324(+)
MCILEHQQYYSARLWSCFSGCSWTRASVPRNCETVVVPSLLSQLFFRASIDHAQRNKSVVKCVVPKPAPCWECPADLCNRDWSGAARFLFRACAAQAARPDPHPHLVPVCALVAAGAAGLRVCLLSNGTTEEHLDQVVTDMALHEVKHVRCAQATRPEEDILTVLAMVKQHVPGGADAVDESMSTLAIAGGFQRAAPRPPCSTRCPFWRFCAGGNVQQQLDMASVHGHLQHCLDLIDAVDADGLAAAQL